jgi:hypothetical protein
MNSVALRIAVLSLAASIPAIATAAPPPDAKQIHGQGCVAAGVEASCLVVKDTASGKLYSLVVKGAKPQIGIGIEFTGVPSSGPTACQQGASVDVANWQRKPSISCKRSSVD